MKHHIRFIVLMTTVTLLGCCGGVQRGQFAVTGSSSHALAKTSGALTVVQGDSMPLSSRSTGEQPLLYILALAPDLTTLGNGFSHGNGSEVSNWEWTWPTAQGQVSTELSWDRETDRVTAGGTTSDRQRGNAFVLVRDASGKTSVTQLGPLDAGLDPADVLQKIQAALPPSSRAKDVALLRWP